LWDNSSTHLRASIARCRDTVRSSELIPFWYFAYVGIAACLRPLTRQRRLVATVIAGVMLLLIWAGRNLPDALRDWAPFIYVSFGYYVIGYLFVRPSEVLEGWLARWDRRLLGDPTTRFAEWPAWFVGSIECLYMATFLILPAGFLLLWLRGRSDLANHYWTLVLAADLSAFAPLAVFQTRPPWLLEPPAVLPDTSVRHLASLMVRRATIQANTFPSGHVAVSFAVAVALAGAMPLASLCFFACAAGISLACVVGRYHYVVDVIAGLLVAAIVTAASALWGL
jgi:membrane-associated phospholipid phosphatase